MTIYSFVIVENMTNRLFLHISFDESTLDQRNNQRSTNQQAKKGEDKKARIQLNMRQPYSEHVKNTINIIIHNVTI